MIMKDLTLDPARGDRREDIYHDDADRQAWLNVLAQVCERFNWSVQAYCMMDNHYHLLVQTPNANLSAGMRQLNGVYTEWHLHKPHDVEVRGVSN